MVLPYYFKFITVFEIKKSKDAIMNHRVKNNRSRRTCRWIIGGNYWFLKYKWKQDLSGDLIAGVTMAIIQIPQGIVKTFFIVM